MENLQTRKPIFLKLIVALGLLGVADSGYLTYKHYFGGPIPCSLTQGCEAVTTSQYSSVFNVPVSALGLFFYSLVVIIGLTALIQYSRHHIHAVLALSFPAFVLSLFFVYIQLFVLRAVCLYCMVSAVLSTLIFILTLLLFKKQRAVTIQNNN